MAEINDFSITDANNTTFGGAEGQNPSTVNNIARALVGALGRGIKDAVEGTINSAGTQPDYTVAANRTLSAYYDGMRQGFHCHSTNASGAATLNIDGVGAKSITKNHNVALAANDLEEDGYYEVIWSASDDAFQLVTPVANESLSSANTFTATQSWSKGADIASANPLVLGADGNYFDVTGTTGIASVTVTAGTLFMLQFDGACLLTHHATNLNLPDGLNQTTAAGDRLVCFAPAADSVHVLSWEATKNVASGNFTRDMTAASGDVSYTGVGFRPSSVIIFGAVHTSDDGFSWGFETADSAGYVASQFSVTASTWNTSAAGNLVFANRGASVQQTANLSTFDQDGFTLAWTKTGSPTGTWTGNFIAYR